MKTIAAPNLPEAALTTSYLSLPAAAFTPQDSTFVYENHGRYLRHSSQSGLDNFGAYYAAVELPQGATITQMTFYFKDEGVGQTSAELVSCSLLSVCTQMAYLQSYDVWSPGWGSVTTTSFGASPTIDNDSHTYSIYMDVPIGGAVWGGGVDLAYTLPSAPATVQKVTVPPPAFSPFEDGYTFYVSGSALVHKYGPGTTNARGWYLAPLHLPDGAAVTEMDFTWSRTSNVTATATALLQRTHLGQDTYENMASTSSDPGAGAFVGTSSTANITNNLINNQLYAYWVLVDLPAVNFSNSYVDARGIEIKYQMFAISHDRMAVPLAGLRFFEDGYDYQDHGRHLIHTYGPNSSLTEGWYYSPLDLPNGASIENLTLYYYKNTATAGTVKLQRTLLGGGNWEDLATLSTGTSSGSGSTNTTSIAGGAVDNAQYGYWIIWVVPPAASGDSVQPQGLVIDYDYKSFMPLVFH
jgi:hypothetical protein